MKFDTSNNSLFAGNGELIKEFDCPLKKECAYINFQDPSCSIEKIGCSSETRTCIEKPEGVFTINTARDVGAINNAVAAGYKVIVRPTNPNDAPEHKVIMTQDIDGYYSWSGFDYRSGLGLCGVQTYKKPNYNRSPYAAYIIPADLPIGKTVFLSDIIDHRLQGAWNQGDEYRQNSGLAIWDGDNMIVEKIEVSEMIG